MKNYNINDYIGQKFNKLTLIEDLNKLNSHRQRLALFKCDCGNVEEIPFSPVLKGYRKSCGCLRKQGHSTKSKINDYIGQKFNKLTLIKDLNKSDSHGQRLALFKCDCGNVEEIPFSSVLKGSIKSCGCIAKPNINNYIGQKFNKLTLIEDLNKLNSHRQRLALFKCDCGNVEEIPFSLVLNGYRKSCGCSKRKIQYEVKCNNKKRHNINDYIGQKFGRLTLIEDLDRTNSRNQGLALFKCDCGNFKEFPFSAVLVGNSKSCGCSKRKIQYEVKCNNKKRHNIDDYVGQKFGKLTLIENLNKLDSHNYQLALFKCDCGNVKEARFSLVFTGKVRSCGCYQSNKKMSLGNFISLMQSNNKSGITGVFWDEKRKKWIARLRFLGHSYEKSFDNKKDAINYRKYLEHKYLDPIINNYIGEKFNKLTLIEILNKTNAATQRLALFKCDCGNVKELPLAPVLKGSIKSCGCIVKHNINDYIGQKFNKLTLIEDLNKSNSRNQRLALFKCDCGNFKEFPFSAVLRGDIKSCGCSKKKSN